MTNNVAIGEETSADVYWTGASSIEQAGGFLPVVRKVKVQEAASIVQPSRVRLRTRLTWLGQNGNSFVKTEEHGEDWYYKYRGSVAFVPFGDWDKRTPVLHSVVAGLDTTDAGFDDAFVRAASALDGLYNFERFDMRGEHREVITKVVKETFSPARLLVRGAVLWASLKLSSLEKRPLVRVDNLGDVLPPVRIASGREYKGFFTDVDNGKVDVVYMRLNSSRDAKCLRVGQALLAEEFPIRGLSNFGIAKLWPDIKPTRVFYNGRAELEDTPNAITAEEVWYTMNRFCQLHDCYDLWQTVLEGVQGFIARPKKAGLVGGSVNAVLALPPSRMRVGLIGPLLAGITTEGMKTTPLAEPNFIEYVYGGVHRAVYTQAALFEGLRELHALHPVSMQLGRASWEHVEQLALPSAASEHWMTIVKPLCARLAWDCVNQFTACICLPYNREMFKYVMQPQNVPSWVQGITHLTQDGIAMLESQLKPARPTELPEANVAYRYDDIGLVSPMQVSSAVERLGATVEYVLTHDGARQSLLTVPPSDTSRFPWLITPRYAGRGVQAVATLIFPRDIGRRYQECDELRKAKLLVNYIHDNVIRAAESLSRTSDEESWLAVQRQFGMIGMLRQLDQQRAADAQRLRVREEPLDAQPEPRTPTQTAQDKLNAAWDIFKKLGQTADNTANQRLHPEIRRRVFPSRVPAADSSFGQEWDAVQRWQPQVIRQVLPDAESRELMYDGLLSAASVMLSADNVGYTDYKRGVKSYIARLLSARRRAEGEEAPVESLEEALEVAEQDATAAGADVAAPDDPEGDDEAIQDFGDGTSQHDSESLLSGVPSVVSTTQNLPGIGFQPAGSSSD